MSFHKFGYSSEQPKLRQYLDLKYKIRSQGKLAQTTHSKLKDDFENELDSSSQDQEKVTEERILASMRSLLCCILNSELSEQFQNNFLDSKFLKDINPQFSDLSNTINK